MKRAIVSVTNDLTTDQRVHRTCMALISCGYEVTLVGRRRPGSLPLAKREYGMFRMRLFFDKGPWFYAEYNIRLFFLLLFREATLIFTNDADTLPAGFLAARLRGLPHVHDCHEYFRGVPELVGRAGVTRIWKWIEDRIIPKLQHIMAVNESVATLYRNEYQAPVHVMRNVPFRKEKTGSAGDRGYGIPGGKPVILYQGAVNVGRGLEEVIRSMHHLRTDAVLVIAGTGDILNDLQTLVRQEDLEKKVVFTGQIPFQELHGLTCIAEIGLSVEKETGINYQNCLPNKFLDYIQARVPVLVTPFPEMKQIVEKYDIGEFIYDHHPEHLAERIDYMLKDAEALARYRRNLEKAAADLCWENESSVLTDLIEQIR